MSLIDILKKDSPIILAATGAVALVMAVYKGIQAPKPEEVEASIPDDADILEKAETYGKAYGEVAAYTVAAVGCVFVGSALGQKQINDISKDLAAIGVGYAALEKKFYKYREKVKEIVDINTQQDYDTQIMDELVEEEIKAESEHPICCGEEKLFWIEHHPNREFTDTIEHVFNAIGEFKDEYYEKGWNTFDRLLELIDNSDIPPLGIDQGWSAWQGANTYGYSAPTIEFKTITIEESEGSSFDVTVIRIPFSPTTDYDEDPGKKYWLRDISREIHTL